MTVLDGIDRLETMGVWQPEDGSAPRDVYVSIGEAELVIEEAGGTALTHWSLPALERRNPGALPARYAPAPGTVEMLEIEEAEMVEALERVHAAVLRGRRPKGRWRRIALGLTIGLTAGFALMALPGALRSHAAKIMPQPAREDMALRLQADLAARTGPACAGLLGTEALDRLADRLLATTPGRIVVLRDLPQPALALPGGVLVLSADLLAEEDDPDIAAGHLLAAITAARADPPLARILSELGPVDLARLLITGKISDGAVADHAARLLSDAPPRPADEALRAAFILSRLAWAPFAQATGRQVGDAAISPPPPALSDGEWQMLRTICED